MSENEKRGFTRRNFVKGSFAGAAVAASALGASSMFGCSPSVDKKGEGSAAEANETIAWSQCNVNCGGDCVFQWHSKDGKVQYMETDIRETTISRHAPACAVAPCVVG